MKSANLAVNRCAKKHKSRSNNAERIAKNDWLYLMSQSIAQPHNSNDTVTAPGYRVNRELFCYPYVVDLGNCHHGPCKRNHINNVVQKIM